MNEWKTFNWKWHRGTVLPYVIHFSVEIHVYRRKIFFCLPLSHCFFYIVAFLACYELSFFSSVENVHALNYSFIFCCSAPSTFAFKSFLPFYVSSSKYACNNSALFFLVLLLLLLLYFCKQFNFHIHATSAASKTRKFSIAACMCTWKERGNGTFCFNCYSLLFIFYMLIRTYRIKTFWDSRHSLALSKSS